MLQGQVHGCPHVLPGGALPNTIMCQLLPICNVCCLFLPMCSHAAARCRGLELPGQHPHHAHHPAGGGGVSGSLPAALCICRYRVLQSPHISSFSGASQAGSLRPDLTMLPASHACLSACRGGDHWEAGLAMEATLGPAEGPLLHPAMHQRQHSATGLPPRGPPAQAPQQRALDAALAAAAAAPLPVRRARSSGSAPAFLEAVAAEVGGATEAGQQAGAAAPRMPAWQSPARVPPLPLARLGSGSNAKLAPPSQQLQTQQSGGSTAREQLDLAPATSAAAPAGLHPAPPQPALSSRTSSGHSSGRRPPGLLLDTEGLTFDSLGLESPDTITPGLQYARQVAQLFVEGRRCVPAGPVPACLLPFVLPAGLRGCCGCASCPSAVCSLRDLTPGA
jgi:hypothetical protein